MKYLILSLALISVKCDDTIKDSRKETEWERLGENTWTTCNHSNRIYVTDHGIAVVPEDITCKE